MKKTNEVLVSVVVITYNSDKYILETLNSVFLQSYKNIELVIADDCSTDNTIKLCKIWLDKNNKRFNGSFLLCSDKNAGVTLNIDRGTRFANGKWIKILAGDDILPPAAVEQSLDYINESAIDTILCSTSASFIAKQDGLYEIIGCNPNPYTDYALENTALKQYKHLLLDYVMPAAPFISKEFLEKVNYYDISFRDVEDYPFWLKITKFGYRIHQNNDLITYFHRSSINSIFQTTNELLLNERCFRINGIFDKQNEKYVLPKISKENVIFYYHYYLDRLRRFCVFYFFKNKNNVVNRCINKLFLILDPIFIKKKIFNITHNKKHTKRFFQAKVMMENYIKLVNPNF